MKLTRAAFAVMIKFSGLVETFDKIHFEVESEQGGEIPEESGNA